MEIFEKFDAFGKKKYLWDWTPAVMNGDLDMVNFLLQLGVNVNMESKFGRDIPLSAAVGTADNQEVVKNLLEQVLTSTHPTAELARFTQLPKWVTETLKVLISVGADVNMPDKDKLTPLDS